MYNPQQDCCLCLSSRDIATILFALRYYQANLDDAKELMRDSGHFVDEKPIVGRELDYLCQYINTQAIDLDGQEVDMVIRLAHDLLESVINHPNNIVSSAIAELDAQGIIALHTTLTDCIERGES